MQIVFDYSILFQFFFLLDKYKETNIQKYNCIKDSWNLFNRASLGEFFQSPFELAFLERNIFYIYLQDKKIGFRIEDGLQERYL